MAKTFQYKAKNRTGHVLAGTIIAENEAAVAGFIRNKGYFVTQIKEQRRKLLQEFWQELTPVTVKALAVFCRQFAVMIDAGMPMLACLHVLIEQTHHNRLKSALQNVYKKVQEGIPLSRAMSEHSQVFPELMISMVEAGELGGVLDIILRRLAVHYEKEHKLNEKVKAAMTYPAVVVSMAILSVTFILIFVLPVFTKLFEDMSLEIPLPTRILLTTSHFLGNNGIFIFVLLVLICLSLGYVAKRADVKQVIDCILFKLPVLGQVRKKIIVARFSRTLSTLLQGSVPLLSAIEVAAKSTGSSNIMGGLAIALEGIRQGLGLATVLRRCGLFPPLVIQMTAIGEETGEIDKMLEKLADFYEDDVDDSVMRLSSMLEPLLIGFLGGIIGFIVIAVVLPMFEAVSAVGRQ